MEFSLLLFLVISSSLATVSVQDTVLIDKVCKLTQAYEVCLSALLSDARSPTADLHGLATISLNLVLANIMDNNRVITKLLGKAQDPNMREALEGCQDLCGKKEAMHEILAAFKALDSKNYIGLNDAAGTIGMDALDCDDMFRQLGIDQSPLGLRNENLFHLSEIPMAIAQMNL